MLPMLKLDTNYDFHELFLNYNLCEPLHICNRMLYT
jgi:hypothetical protein